MAKKAYPAWQEVVLTALRCVPKGKDGPGAWSRLNEEEQAAVLAFLGEHCGGEQAQTALEDTIALYKRTTWKDWLGLAAWLALWTAIVVAGIWLEEQTGFDIHLYLMTGLCASKLWQAWRALPGYRMAEIWRKHVDTGCGTQLALQDMYRHFMLPRKERVSKGSLCFWGITLALYIALTCFDIAGTLARRSPSLASQVGRQIAAMTEGEGSMEDVLALLRDVPESQLEQLAEDVWSSAARWSDERFLAAALAVRLEVPYAADYAREALLTTRLGAIDTPGEAAEFPGMLALCGEEVLQLVRERVEAIEFPQREALLSALD